MLLCAVFLMCSAGTASAAKKVLTLEAAGAPLAAGTGIGTWTNGWNLTFTGAHETLHCGGGGPLATGGTLETNGQPRDTLLFDGFYLHGSCGNTEKLKYEEAIVTVKAGKGVLALTAKEKATSPVST